MKTLKINNIKFLFKNKSINSIEDSGLFLDSWYKTTYAESQIEAIEGIDHFINVGWKEGKKPNPYFDTAWYMQKYDVPDNTCPLIHYLKHPKNQTSESFNGANYSKSYRKKGNPLSNYLKSGIKNNHLINIQKLDVEQKIHEVKILNIFDEQWYLHIRPDLRGSDINLLEHYLVYGWKEGSSPNKYFDPVFYQKQLNEDQKETDPLIHYMKIGWKQGIAPSREFCGKKYLESNHDVKNSKMNPLFHYMNYGIKENREIFSVDEFHENDEIFNTGLFLEDWYVQYYEDLRDSGINGREHFNLFGLQENRMPNPYFDPIWYKQQYGDLIPNKMPSLIFYSNDGWKLGHNPSNKFDNKKYIEEYLGDHQTEPLKHFLQEGKKAGNTAIATNAKQTSQGGKLKYDPSAKTIDDAQLRALIDFNYQPLEPSSKQYTNKLNIHWVIPDFSPGAGGHMTIFRMVRFLEIFGHTNTIWIYNPTVHTKENYAYEDIVSHFQLIQAQVYFINSKEFNDIQGDAIIATDWGSVSIINSVCNFKRRFYFVQDHEPEFYAQGSYAISARNTYSFDLDCICASPWLEQLMQTKYNRWSKAFWLSVDFDTYNKQKIIRNDRKVHIAFYARHFTSRRAVELGILALEKVAKSNQNIVVHCFGAPLNFDTAPFRCIDHGICSTDELANLYNSCDLGVVFSATNYSLIPQEMMACGLPVAELDTESTRAIFPKGIVTLLSSKPNEMAEQLVELINNKPMRLKQAELAYKWVSQFTWEDAGRIVESAIFERLEFNGYTKASLAKKTQPKASVIIPTWNAGDIFKKVIDQLLKQKAPWEYEILVVDSGSSDGTVDFIKSQKNVLLHQIPNSEFQHGRTRNLAISLTSGEFIAVLTQDALPIDEYWLYNMVTSIDHYPNAAGCFGKHFAWPDADPFTKRDLENHFNNIENYPIVLSKNTDETKWESGDQGWRQLLHFYSDNNSIMRREVWQHTPYPEVKFGEDQAWANLIIQLGYEKVYCKQGAVYHSHDFDEGNVEKRAFEEAEFFRDIFGYKIINPSDADQTIKNINKSDIEWANKSSIPKELIDRRIKANKAKISGYKEANS